MECYVKFQRYSSSFVFTVYIPAAIVVLLSIASFWIRPALVTARVAVGITSVLCETVIMIGALNAYSLTSYVKGLDLYTTICFFFTIGVAIEYAIVYINNRNKYFAKKQVNDAFSFITVLLPSAKSNKNYNINWVILGIQLNKIQKYTVLYWGVSS